jgi:hypothetical protein
LLSKDILDKYRPWLISVARTGSSTLPWVDEPRDTDFIFYVTDNTIFEKVFEIHRQKPQKECWLIDIFGKQGMRLYAYQYQFLKPVYGEEFPTYSVLEHIPEYKKLLIDLGLHYDFDPQRKHWYHILTGIYFIQNGKYELTEEQAQNVRLCHGRKMTLELYNYIQEQLLKYEKELEL